MIFLCMSCACVCVVFLPNFRCSLNLFLEKRRKKHVMSTPLANTAPRVFCMPSYDSMAPSTNDLATLPHPEPRTLKHKKNLFSTPTSPPAVQLQILVIFVEIPFFFFKLFATLPLSLLCFSVYTPPIRHSLLSVFQSSRFPI